MGVPLSNVSRRCSVTVGVHRVPQSVASIPPSCRDQLHLYTERYVPKSSRNRGSLCGRPATPRVPVRGVTGPQSLTRNVGNARPICHAACNVEYRPVWDSSQLDAHLQFENKIFRNRMIVFGGSVEHSFVQPPMTVAIVI